MSENERFTTAIKSAESMMEQLGKAFGEVESHRKSLSNNTMRWEDMKEYLQNLQKSLHSKFIELEEMEKKLEEKESRTQAMLAEREAAVAAREHALFDQLQELKDIAVSAIIELREKCNVASPKVVDVGGGKENKVSIFANADTNTPNPSPEEKLPDGKSGEPAEQMAAKGHVNSILKELCEQMDAKGLLKHISENRKNLSTLREELPLALKSATEPARLVLDALEGFYPRDQPNSQGNEKDTALQGLRRSCLILMESAASVLDTTEPGDVHPLSSEIKQQAKAIADEWKPKLAGVNMDASNGNTLEAQAFLQLLATYRIAPEFDDDELCKMILAVSRRRQTPELCRSLGLAHKMPGLVETLLNSRRHIDAVHFAQAFQLTKSFPPVPMLKAYLNELGTNAKEIGGGSGDTAMQKDANSRELGALKAVIKCIEEYKLKDEYSIGPLQKRVAELEKAKTDKKRNSESTKFQVKKRQANTRYTPHKPTVATEYRPPPQPPVYEERGLYYGVSERYHQYAAPPAYEVPSHGPYVHQPNVPRQYQYPSERTAPAPYGASPSYGSYLAPGSQTAHTSHGNYPAAGGQPGSSYSATYTAPGYQSYSSSYGSYAGAGYQPSHQPYM